MLITTIDIYNNMSTHKCNSISEALALHYYHFKLNGKTAIEFFHSDQEHCIDEGCLAYHGKISRYGV